MKDLDLLAFNESDDMIVKFETNNGRVSGTQNLIQHIIKRIFTIQGSNTFNPEIGGQFNLLFKALVSLSKSTLPSALNAYLLCAAVISAIACFSAACSVKFL